MFGVERANGLVGQAEMVRRDLGGDFDLRRARGAHCVDRLAGGEMEDVQRPALVRGERQVTRDHHALGDRRVAGEAELGGDVALVHLTALGERRLLAVEREPAAGDRAVLERPAHQAGRLDGHAVVREGGSARVGELGHLGQLPALLALRDRGEEADRDLRLLLRRLDERAEHRGRVDHRLGVRHGEDRAVAAGGRGLRPVAIVSSSSRPGVRRWT